MKIAVFIALVIATRSFSTLAYSETEKAKIVEKVYAKMCAALATANEMPKLVFNSQRALQIAYMTKDKDGAPIIGFESKAFDVCEQMGARMEDAIAFLLGHELSHHVLSHHWGDEFKTAYSLGALEKDIRDIDRAGVKKFETQADERGGILCYLAGYGTNGIGEKLLTNLYKAYNIGVEASAKYPSLEERILVAREQDSIVQSYIRIYETGNYAMLIGEYDLAINCYLSIINKYFHSSSIYNNLGVAYFLSAAKADDLNPLKYYYPIELDVLLIAKDRGSKGMGEKDPKLLYEQALKRFKQAIDHDPTNLTPQLNMLCTYSAMGDTRKALFNLEDLEKNENLIKNKNTLANTRLLKAILLHQTKDEIGAIAMLKELEKGGSALATVNRKMIENNDELSDVVSSVPRTSWAMASGTATTSTEKINDVSIYSITEMNRMFTMVETLQINKSSEVIVGSEKDNRIYVFINPENVVYAFHATLPGYKGKTAKGLLIGASQADLAKLYGPPDNMMSSNAGTYYLYAKQQIVFQVNAEGTVSSWSLIKNVL